MKICTFFGHRDAPSSIRETIKAAIVDLIVKKGVEKFYLGDNGKFDRMALGILRELKKQYGQISYTVVLSRIPTANVSLDYDTILPEGIENSLPKYAIVYRNIWMIEKSDYVVCYVRRSYGGAYRFKEMAKRKNKVVVEL